MSSSRPSVAGAQTHSAHASLPVPFALDDTASTGEPGLETTQGKALLLEAKRRALTEEVYVEPAMLKAPTSFDALYELLVGRSPASLFRLINVDQSWMDAPARYVDTVERLQMLFDAFRECGVTVKVKIIFSLKRVWETKVFEQFLSHVLERTLHNSHGVAATMDLYHLAVILSFDVPNLSKEPADIFPYGRTAEMWLKKSHGDNVEAAVRSIMCSYYIRIVHNIFTMNNVQNLNHIKPILSKFNVTHQTRVVETDGGLGKFVDQVMFSMLCHQKSSVCAMGVFLIVQMLSTKNPRLEQFVRNHDFVTPLRDATKRGAYAHSVWACSHLIKLLLSPPHLQEQALPCFSLWYEDAFAQGEFSVHDLSFRFAFEFVSSILRDGLEHAPSGSRPGVEMWASPVRNAYVLSNAIDAILDVRSPPRELRALQTVRLLFTTRWTTKRDIAALTHTPGALPNKASVLPPPAEGAAGEANNAPLNKSGSGLMPKAKKSPFFGKRSKGSTLRKHLATSTDNQDHSPLLTLPEAVLLRILNLVGLSDLLHLCCTCWRLHDIVDNPAHHIWRLAYLREQPRSMHSVAQQKGKEDPAFWKTQCKALLRGALPYAINKALLAANQSMRLYRGEIAASEVQAPPDTRGGDGAKILKASKSMRFDEVLGKRDSLMLMDLAHNHGHGGSPSTIRKSYDATASSAHDNNNASQTHHHHPQPQHHHLQHHREHDTNSPSPRSSDESTPTSPNSPALAAAGSHALSDSSHSPPLIRRAGSEVCLNPLAASMLTTNNIAASHHEYLSPRNASPPPSRPQQMVGSGHVQFYDPRHIDGAQACVKELIVVGAKVFGTIMRIPMWWSEIEPYLESHWLALLVRIAHEPDSLDVSRSGWRAFYQLLAYNPGMVDRLIENGYMEMFLRPLDMLAANVVLFNGLYYVTKLLANDPPTMPHRKRLARKDVQTLAAWIRDRNLWPQWHTMYNAYQTNPKTNSFIFPGLASLFSAVNDSFLCKKLKSSLFKVPDYHRAITGVRDLYRGKMAGGNQSDDDTQAIAPRPKGDGVSTFEVRDASDETAAGKKEPVAPAKPAKTGSGSRKSEKRDVTASGVKVFRDFGRHGCRCIDIDDGVALIRRHSDPGPGVEGVAKAHDEGGYDIQQRRQSAPNL